MSQDIRSATIAEQLLSVEAVAERLDTKPRFVRRLIAERRIEYHKVGRHVRISESALAAFGNREGRMTSDQAIITELPAGRASTADPGSASGQAARH